MCWSFDEASNHIDQDFRKEVGRVDGCGTIGLVQGSPKAEHTLIFDLVTSSESSKCRLTLP